MAGNPFLQTSNFPEGTVFIVVGSCLAGLALMLIASRAIYIWCLHRQTKQRGKDVKYSEMEQRPFTATSGNPVTAPFTATPTSGNNISLDYLRPGDRSSRISTFSSRPSTGRPQTSSLRPVSNSNPLSTSSVQFYSPSAHPGGTTAAALGSQSSRDSAAYLPAGYYLRDSSSANNNTSTASPRQMYNTPVPTTSFLYSDPSATPIPRLSRSPTANSASTMGGGGAVVMVAPRDLLRQVLLEVCMAEDIIMEVAILVQFRGIVLGRVVIRMVKGIRRARRAPSSNNGETSSDVCW